MPPIRLRSLALPLALCFSLAPAVLQAAEEERLEPVVITASRSAAPLPAKVLGASFTVIDSDDLSHRQVRSMADVLRDVPGARLHLTHVSTAAALEVVRRAKAAGLPVTCDVTPHHLALTDEWIAGARRWAWNASGDP